MIVVTATGFISEKPMLQSFRTAEKVEFDVISSRREKSGNEWVTQYERATFVAWGEEAVRIAEQFDRGHIVTATGNQKTSKWTDQSGQKRSKVKYDLLRCERVYTPSHDRGDRAEQGEQPTDGRDDDGHGHHNRPRQPYAQNAGSRPPQRYAKPMPEHVTPQDSGGGDDPEVMIP